MDGQYFRNTILTEHVISLLIGEENVIDLDEMIFSHGKAPCMPANETQNSLLENEISFWENRTWPEN